MNSSKTKSYNSPIVTKKLQRSISPSGSFCSSTISSSSSAFDSSMSSFSSPTRSTYPNRITVSRGYNHIVASSPSVRFSIDRRNDSATSTSHKKTNQNVTKSISNSSSNKVWSNGAKKTCMCSPTTHPGSFRCSLHRNGNQSNNNGTTSSYHSHRLYARRSAMTSSLVRIGTVEGDLVKRALATLIRPSSHQQRRRSDFQPKPSRLSVMSKRMID